ncbi:DinB family protein [Saccharibacillus sp. JS10]|uniref:DinB family protein n=1 Tax=Saccharibacillus sp. JS10 TaxID=2950552 RepID=UPI00210A5892|nr:DinB family protein [Saccharibacillus sp. JS10]MCQ4085460.1 DinB family protein [Saccharibacillus sp. JS10]
MSHFVIDQLSFIRRQTLDYVSNLDESISEIIPVGLKNNIKWNLGHLYVVFEKFALQLTGQETQYPTDFNKWFDPGTQPAEWKTTPPTLSQISDLLTEQFERAELILSSKTQEEIHPHYKSSTGLTFTNVEQLLGFLIYHEAMHFATIKNLKSIIQNQG